MKYNHVHFTGIKGVGMTPLAIIAKEAGCIVTGSDVGEDFITKIPLENAGITPLVGFDGKHIASADLVVVTGAHGGAGNIEVQAAKQQGIKVVSQAEFISMIIDGEIAGRQFDGIAIAGTHGKTTTTAMTTTVLMENDLDPSYLIGTSTIPSLLSPGHYGKGKFFVLEADEYATDPVYDKKPKFLWQRPKIAVFTNIEHDHIDIFKSLDEVREAFLQLASQIKDGGVLIACGDDPEVRKVIKEYSGHTITYGFSPENDYIITRVSVSQEYTFFWLQGYGSDFGEFSIAVTGEHNALNAAASIVVATEVGLSIEQSKKAIKLFKGSKRRFECVGKLISGALLYDDYAHHPTEIKKTLRAMRQLYPKKKIITIFQPHTYSRTKQLFDQFIRSFNDTDTLLLTEIFASKREEPDPSVSSIKLSQSLKQVHKDVSFLGELSDVVEYIKAKNPGEEYVVLTMGAGDIYTVKDQLQFVK